MRTLRGAVASVIALALAALIPSSAAHAAPPAAPYSALILDGRAGSYILSGTLAFGNGTGTVTASPFGQGGISIDADSPGHDYFTRMAPPSGQLFTAGTTYSTDVTSFHLSGDGRGCNQQPGSFIVHEAVYNAESTLTAFAATASIGCEGPTVSTVAEIRWNSSIGYKAVLTSAGFLSYNTQDLGVETAPQTITVSNGGTEAAVLGAASLGGVTPGAFRITSDNCAGKTLAFGETCTIGVAAKATAVGAQYGQLVIPDNTNAGNKIVTLGVTGQVSIKGMYHPLSPSRILDTRSGNGAAWRKVNDYETVSLQVTGRGGVPANGISAVVLNVTVTEADQAGHVTVYPTGVAKPTASSLNYTRGWTGANSVTVKVGADGKVNLAITGGKLHLIADVVGFYAQNNDAKNGYYGTSGRVFTHEPVRLFDSREDWGDKLYSQEWVKLTAGYSAATAPHVKAFIVNVTATEPNGAGHLRTWNGAGSPPDTSTLNFERGKTVPNFAIVPATTCDLQDCNGKPMIGVYTNTDTHVIVDIVGFIDDGTLEGGMRFEPRTPERIVDTRINQGITGRIGQAVTKTVTTPGTIANADTYALALNVTGVQPTVDTNMIVWENGITKPGVSNLNPAAGQIAPNAVVTGIDTANQFNVYNHGGTIDTVIDVVGTFYWIEGLDGFSASARGATAHSVPADGFAPAIGSVSRQR